MKTSSDNLFQLIKSLSKQEKRYFKLHASRHIIGEQNNYVLIFDAIEKQSTYNEQKLKEQFKNKAFIRQFHVIKNYLYKLILNSLRNYYSNNEKDQFHTLLRNAQILFDKGLLKQSEKVLNKAKKAALKNERFLQILEIYRWEHSIIHNKNELDRLENYIQHGYQEEMDIIHKYQNLIQFQLLNDKYFIHYWKNGIARNDDERAQLKKLLEDKIYQEEANALSIPARFFYFNALFTHYYCTNQLEKGYSPMQKLVHMLETAETGFAKDSSKYISALNNLYAVQQQLKKTDEALNTLEKLKKVPVQSISQKSELFIRSTLFELDIYLSTGKFDQGAQKLDKIISEFNIYVGKIDIQSRLAFYYNTTYIYFGTGSFSKALDWNNELLNDPDLSVREDIHCFGRILNLFIHYELGNEQLLEYIVEQTHRFLQKRKRLFKVETIILNFIKKYPNWIKGSAMIQKFKELHHELEVLLSDDYEKHAFEYFDFLSWLESKIQKKPFAAVLQKKLNP